MAWERGRLAWTTLLDPHLRGGRALCGVHAAVDIRCIPTCVEDATRPFAYSASIPTRRYSGQHPQCPETRDMPVLRGVGPLLCSGDPARYRRAVKGRPGGSPVGCSARWVRNLGQARRRNFGQARKFAGLEGRLLPQETAGRQIRVREHSQTARQRANIAPSCKAAPSDQPTRVNHESGGQGCQLRTRLSSVPANFCACPEILGKFCACPEVSAKFPSSRVRCVQWGVQRTKDPSLKNVHQFVCGRCNTRLDWPDEFPSTAHKHYVAKRDRGTFWLQRSILNV